MPILHHNLTNEAASSPSNGAICDKFSEQYHHQSIKKHRIYCPISTKKIPDKYYEMSNAIINLKKFKKKIPPPPSQSLFTSTLCVYQSP